MPDNALFQRSITSPLKRGWCERNSARPYEFVNRPIREGRQFGEFISDAVVPAGAKQAEGAIGSSNELHYLCVELDQGLIVDRSDFVR